MPQLLRAVGGLLLLLIGLVWIGQGFNMIGGSSMSGHPIFALFGLVLGVVGAWLCLGAARAWSRTA